MELLFRLICRHPWLVLGACLLVTAAFASQLWHPATGLRLEIDASTERLLPEGDPDKEYYDYIRQVFGSDETMVVALHADDLFTTENLARVKRMTQRIRAIDGVRSVTSLTNATNVIGSADGLDVRPFVTDVPTDRDGLARVRAEVLDNPIYAGSLISRDARTTALVVSFVVNDREFVERGIDESISTIAREEAGDAEVWLAGGPHVRVNQIQLQLRDLGRSIPLILAVLAIVLAVSFRTLRGVALPLLTIVLSLVWTLGTAAWLGRSLNIVTVLVPPLMLILGLSYSVHVVSEYYETLREQPDLDSGTAALEALRLVWLPVTLTGLTTGAGFLALALSPMRAVAETGMLSLLGVGYTLVASLVVPPAALALSGAPRRARRPHQTPGDRFTWFAEIAADLALRHRQAILIGSGVVFALAVVAFTRLEIGADTIQAFPEDSRVRLDFEAVNAELQGANQFNVIVRGAEDGLLRKPEVLAEIAELQAWLTEQPEIGGTTSVVDYLRLINRGFHENDPAHLAIPESERLATQLIFFGGNEELDRFLDVPHRTANVVVRSNVIDTEKVSALVARIERRLLDLPVNLEGRVTGNAVLLNGVIDDIIRGQALSMVGALVLIYFILTFFFLDPRTGLKALIPNVIPIAAYFGALGLSGITLNPSTSVIAPMALGIAIDDTIHYFSRFTRDAKLLADEKRATVSALRAVGRPVTYTTIAICLGFLVLTTSDLANFVEVGALGAFTLAFAWFVDFTVTPALCSGLRIVTLWDTLTFDLGENPQASIPIFRGLTTAQCRVVALMASVRRVDHGQPLMRAGESGREMYVVIEGRLRVWVPGDAGPIELNTCARGDTVGEAGLFHGERSANVDVLEDARLLRITQNNMERLHRRYPKTAARVFWNLNEVVSDHLRRTTSRLH